MKIGIMSMQRVINYGSYLQAYGLKKTIEQLGHEVVFVDFREGINLVEQKPYKATIAYKCLRFVWRKLKKAFQRCLEKEKRTKKTGFEQFLNEFESSYLSDLGVSDKKQYGLKVDVLVIGSDEVFNCTQDSSKNGYSKELFGANNNASKIISYAASFGNTTLDKLKKYSIDKEISQLFNNFQALSVRDKNSLDIVKELTGRDAKLHLDPVLIYDYAKDIIDNVERENYLIVYAYSNRISEEEGKAIQEFASSKNKKIITISGRQNFESEYVYGHPLQILAYFKHADYVITDTFHGTIFSVINNRPFATLIRNEQQGYSYGNEEKLSFLLQKLCLEERQIKNLSELNGIFEREIDYTLVNKIIEKEKGLTKAYLKKELSL